MKITLTLPYLPQKELSPNWKPFTLGARWVFIAARDGLRDAIYYEARQALMLAGIEDVPAFKAICITYTFICPTNRRRDSDNWVSRMKAAQDALVLAEVVADDTHEQVKVADPIFRIEKGWSETIIEIEEIAEVLQRA